MKTGAVLLAALQLVAVAAAPAAPDLTGPGPRARRGVMMDSREWRIQALDPMHVVLQCDPYESEQESFSLG